MFSKKLDPKRKEKDKGWFFHKISLDEFAEETVDVAFKTEAFGRGGDQYCHMRFDASLHKTTYIGDVAVKVLSIKDDESMCRCRVAGTKINSFAGAFNELCLRGITGDVVLSLPGCA